MDGHQPPHPPDGQPDYPPMPQGQEDPYLQQHAHLRAPAPPGTAPHHQAPPPHHMHHAPPTAAATTAGYGGMHHPGAPPPAGGGGSAMSALTAAAAAAQPATPTMHPGAIHHPSQPTLPARTPSQGAAGQGSTGASGVQSPLKVVESGHEHTGRWTKEEHEAFLAALQLYGKEWKKVAAKVKTRTVVQTRTHAQKYFQKLQKSGGEKEGNQVHGMPGVPGLGMGGVSPAVAHSNLTAVMDLGVPNSSEKTTTKKKRGKSSAQKQKQQQQQQQQLQHAHYQPPPHPAPTQSPAAAAAMSRSSSATAAALLNMSNDRRLSATGFGPPSSTTAGAYSVSVPNPTAHQQHGFTTTAASVGDASASAHGFGYPAATTGAKPISIVAPTHEDMVKVGKFPEPSPAACGKRKMAEIAAAQMLAGVVGATVAKQGAANASGPAQKKRASVTGSAAIAAAESAANVTESATPVMPPESSYPEPTPVGGGDQLPTPPPPQEEYVAALKPAAAESAQPGSMVGRGLSLQIVNPDTLAAQGNGTAKRRFMNGQASPSTPWDGQMAALVSQVNKGQEPPPQDPNADDPASISENAMVNQEEVMAAVSELNILLPLPLRSPRSSLQIAVCHGSVNEVSQICASLTVSNSSIVAERDDAGYYPLHSAAALGLVEHFGSNSAEAMEICRLLIECGADVACVDAQGNTPVHWAARAGHTDVLGLLLLKSCPLDAQNDAGETALHWAMRAGAVGAGAVKVLVENGARVNVFNRSFRRPLDVAAEGFAAMEEEGPALVSTKVDQPARRCARWNLMRYSAQCRTLVLHHQECLDHLAKTPHDWEVPDRIDNIMSTLMSRTNDSCLPGDEQGFKPYEVTISTEFERATLELLSRIHSAEYLAFVNDLSKELERKRKLQILEDNQSPSAGNGQDGSGATAVVPFTPMVQRKIMKEETTKEGGHSDTAFSAGSLKAARRAAGAVQHAVDCVLVGRNRNAFCIVRPPGHHAGINGLLSDAESCGFCLFNNVAAGAMHALSDEKHRPRCERCAIVDIDAHHGNGTEEIVRKCHDSGRLLFFSVHLYDHDKPKKGQTFQYKFYPGSGAEDDVAHNIINVPIAPLWREKEVVKSISLAANGGPSVPEPRQTRQRSKEDAAKRVPSLPDLSKFNNDEAAQAASLKPSSGASVGSASVTSESSQSSKPRSLPSTSPHYPPHYQMGTGRLAYRRAIQHRLLPALRAFNPDLIILSTGFDAARGDVGNARHYVNGTEAMGFDLEPSDYAWTARKVCEIADICCDGRVVSVLEGGYGRTPPPVPPPPVFGDGPVEPTEPVKQKLDKSFFSECAVQHLKGLVDPYDADNDLQNDAKRP